MLMFGKQGRWLSFVLGALVVLGLSGPSFAGTVFTWETDDGTISFTDEAKRIPSRYKLSAKTREMGKLKAYPRYTHSKGDSEVSYTERLTERLQDLNGEVRRPADVQRGQGASPGFDGRAISLGGSRYGSGVRYQIPAGGVEAASGPTVIEQVRVRSDDSLATRSMTVVRQNGRVVAVTKGQLNQRSWAGTTATGQDEEDVLR